MIKKIFSNQILSKSLQTMVIQAIGQICAFITAIVLARYLGISSYGLYVFGCTVATILAVIATMGAGGILARSWGKSDLNKHQRDKQTFLIHNWYFKRGFFFIILVITIIISYNYLHHDGGYIENLSILFGIPFFMANILQSFFVAKRAVISANILQLGLRIIMLLLAMTFMYLHVKNTATLVGSMMIFITMYTTLIWFLQISKYSFKSFKPNTSNLSFALMQWGLLLLSQIDILIIRMLSVPSDVALYGVALQLAALVSFVLNAVNSNVLSQIADDYKNSSKEEFQKKITSYTRIIFVLSIFVIFALIVCGYPMTLFYGDRYTTSYFIFCILMVGQIVNVFSGCVATILNMTGFERSTCFAFYIALGLNLVLGVVFTLYWGIYGLAVASSLAMIYWNIHLLYKVTTKISINPTIFRLR